MPCNDTVIFPFLGVPDGSAYELEVTCPPGAAATAVVTDKNQPPPKQWTQNEISSPGKQQVVHSPGPHSVVISIAFGGAAPVMAKVEARVKSPAGAVLQSYCREVTGANGQTEVITHTIHMA